MSSHTVTERTCSNCKKFYVTRPSRRLRFCSWECTRAARRKTRVKFWDKVQVVGECWLWCGALGDNGYGLYHDGAKMVRAHRFSFQMEFGAIPKGALVLHRCDVRRCVRPEHLFAGSQLDNVRDMHAKGRGACGDRNGLRAHPEKAARGAKNGNAKLTKKKVQKIKELFAQRVMTKTIAERFGVSISAVESIKYGKTWAHVSFP